MANPANTNPFPVEILVQIAAAAHPVNRMSMRLSRQYLADAMSEATAEETIAAMLQSALKEFAMNPGAQSYADKSYVDVHCHCPPGPEAKIEFMPRNRKRFIITYKGPASNLPNIRIPSQRFYEPHNVVLRLNATVHDAISLLQLLGCRPRRAVLSKSHSAAVRHFL